MHPAVARLLTAPAAEDLWRLRGDLLEKGVARGAAVWGVVDAFQRYLDTLATSTSSRDYSELASLLDISAVGGVLLENALETRTCQELAERVFTGALSEGLMVLATRQHVKAWEQELCVVYREGAWFLYQELWAWAEEQNPSLPAAERRKLLDGLLAPVLDPEVRGLAKAALVGRLFQLLLVIRLAQALASSGEEG